MQWTAAIVSGADITARYPARDAPKRGAPRSNAFIVPPDGSPPAPIRHFWPGLQPNAAPSGRAESDRSPGSLAIDRPIPGVTALTFKSRRTSPTGDERHDKRKSDRAPVDSLKESQLARKSQQRASKNSGAGALRLVSATDGMDLIRTDVRG